MHIGQIYTGCLAQEAPATGRSDHRFTYRNKQFLDRMLRKLLT